MGIKFKSKRKNSGLIWAVVMIVIVVLLLDAKWIIKGVALVVLLITTSLSVSDIEMDDLGINIGFAFVPWLPCKCYTWESIELINISRKSAFVQGSKNPSRIYVTLKEGRKINFIYEPSQEEVEIIRELALHHNVDFEIKG